MSRVDSIEVHHYRIPLPTVLSDSTHGEISHSGLVVAQVRDTDGAEGIGYTYTVNDIGSRAIRALVEHDLAPLLAGEDARAIDRLWEWMWWHVHFCGRGGVAAFAMAAVDVALWDPGEAARRAAVAASRRPPPGGPGLHRQDRPLLHAGCAARAGAADGRWGSPGRCT